MRNFNQEKDAVRDCMMRIIDMLDRNVYTEEFAFKQLELLEAKISKIEQEENDYNLADYRELY